MPAAMKPTKNQLRRAKKKAAKQIEVSYFQNLTECCTHSISQATTTPTPETSAEPESAPVKTEPAIPAADQQDEITNGVDSLHEETLSMRCTKT